MTDIQKIKDILASADVIHTEEEVAAAPAGPTQEELLAQIRDELRAQRA